MNTLKYALLRQWGFILLALLSILTSLLVKLPTWWLAVISIIIIIVNETIVMKRSHRQKTLEIASKLRDLTQELQDRFVNTGSAYSILYLIKELGDIKSEKQEILKEWASGCMLGKNFLEDGLYSLVENLNLIVRSGARQTKELVKRFEEFRDMNKSYYRLVEAFHAKAKTGDIPESLEKCYSDFKTEYNSFVQNLRNTMDDARKMLPLNIDPKYISFAKELNITRWG